ncbi:MAG: hypothetical protein E7029_01525 [Planctomycetaceae bacterium]|nr:hypothetical protein [Planctomycetaceae bacterium]
MGLSLRQLRVLYFVLPFYFRFPIFQSSRMPQAPSFPHRKFRIQRSLQLETLESRELLSAVSPIAESVPFSVESKWEIRAGFTPVKCEHFSGLADTDDTASSAGSCSSLTGVTGELADIFFSEEPGSFEGSGTFSGFSQTQTLLEPEASEHLQPECALPSQLSVPAELQTAAASASSDISGTAIQVSWDPVPNASRYRLTYTLTHPECEPIQLRKIYAAASLDRTATGRLTAELDAVIPGTTVELQIQAVSTETAFTDSELSAAVTFQTPSLTQHTTLTLENGTEIPDVFALHSRTQSEGETVLTIYLDFTGHLTGGTAWNTQTSQDLIVSPVFSIDEDSAFSTEELRMIYEIWKIVSEDYAGFAVDVTTEFPGLEHLKRSSTSDSRYGIRCVFSENTWYSNVGGIALRNSFTYSSDLPCFVFLDRNARTVGNAASHEIGHTLGLQHRGGGSAANGEYSYGVKVADEIYVPTSNSSVSDDGYVLFDSSNSVICDWSPIMGASYYAKVSHWSDGTYFNAQNSGTSQLGDLEKLNTYLPLRNDDYADWSFSDNVQNAESQDSASFLTSFGEPDSRFAPIGELLISPSGTLSTDGDFFHDSFFETVSGFITHRDDTDVFRLTLEEETQLELTVTGAGEWADLDIWAALYPESVLTASDSAFPIFADDPDSMDAVLSVPLQAGTYFLVIDGTGRTRTLENGQEVEYYSDYSSIGRYCISGYAEPVSKEKDETRPNEPETNFPEEEIPSFPITRSEFYLAIRPAQETNGIPETNGSSETASSSMSSPSETSAVDSLPISVTTVSSWTPLALEIWMNGAEISSSTQSETLLLNFDTEKYSWDPASFTSADSLALEITEHPDGLLLHFTGNALSSGSSLLDGLHCLGCVFLTPKFEAFSGSVSQKTQFQLDGKTSELAVTTVCYDLNSDGTIDIHDLVQLARQYGNSEGTPADLSSEMNRNGTVSPDLSADFDCDGCVSIKDLVLLAKNFGLNFQRSDSLYFASAYRSAAAAEE